MSICNLHVAPDKVWLATDTALYLRGEPVAFGAKFSIFPAIMSLVGFRGTAGLHRQIDLFLGGAGRVVDIEQGVGRLPFKLRRWTHELREDYPDADIKAQAWVCGWSPIQRRFGGWKFESPNFEPVELAVPSTWLNPSSAGFQPPAELASPDALIRCTEVQREMSEMNRAAGDGDLGVGGEIVLTKLTRAGFEISKVHRFDDYAEIKESIRAAA